jgi:mycothiol S-conjugate amidase
MSQRLRLLAIHAHPDDESSKGAASMAYYAANGVDVHVLTLTGGERGDVLNPALIDHVRPEDIAAIRREEMALAVDVLGVTHEWLGYVDSGLPEGDPLPPLPDGCFALADLDEATAGTVEVIRRFRPHVVTTYDETGGYPHPDHIRCHEVSVAAFEAAGDPDAYPEAGEPWQPSKLYYHVSFDRTKILSLHEAATAEGIESPYSGERFAKWLSGEEVPKTPPITSRVVCADYFATRDDALRAHATQVDPNGRWFSLPLELQGRVWPTEDFHLARSHVESTLPEDDLFAGLRNGTTS